MSQTSARHAAMQLMQAPGHSMPALAFIEEFAAYACVPLALVQAKHKSPIHEALPDLTCVVILAKVRISHSSQHLHTPTSSNKNMQTLP